MNQILLTAWVLLFPAGCTALGAAGVFLLRRTARPCTQRILCGMAAGIMLAASVWSLLLPAIERARQQAIPAWIAPSVALVLGAVGLLQLEQAAGELLAGGSGHGGRMVLAVTLHNLPEGMVVGLAAALALTGEPDPRAGVLGRGSVRPCGAAGGGAGLCTGRVGRRGTALAYERGGRVHGLRDGAGDDPAGGGS